MGSLAAMFFSIIIVVGTIFLLNVFVNGGEQVLKKIKSKVINKVVDNKFKNSSTNTMFYYQNIFPALKKGIEQLLEEQSTKYKMYGEYKKNENEIVAAVLVPHEKMMHKIIVVEERDFTKQEKKSIENYSLSVLICFACKMKGYIMKQNENVVLDEAELYEAVSDLLYRGVLDNKFFEYKTNNSKQQYLYKKLIKYSKISTSLNSLNLEQKEQK